MRLNWLLLTMTRWWVVTTIFVVGVCGASPVWAQQDEVASAVHDATVAARAVAELPVEPADPDAEFSAFVEDQASLEMQIGLRLYEEYDDYRAITAFRRYQMLQPGSARAQFLASLMIGQIYHRNDKPELSALSFERAARAAEQPYARTFAYLMALQQLCIPLSTYVQCRHRLDQLLGGELEPGARELVEYQRMYTDVVLRLDGVTAARAARFESEKLRVRAVGLVAEDRAFEELRLRSPALAGTMSALLPGSGQLYNGRPIDGLLALVITGAFGAGTYFAFTQTDSIPLGVVLAGLTAGFYSGNIVNAVVDAKKINARRYLRFFENLKTNYWPRVGFVIEENEVLFTYGFDWPGPTLENRTSSPSGTVHDRGHQGE